MDTLPVELLPRIIPNPEVAAMLAAAAKWLGAAIPPKLFKVRHVAGYPRLVYNDYFKDAIYDYIYQPVNYYDLRYSTFVFTTQDSKIYSAHRRSYLKYIAAEWNVYECYKIYAGGVFDILDPNTTIIKGNDALVIRLNTSGVIINHGTKLSAARAAASSLDVAAVFHRVNFCINLAALIFPKTRKNKIDFRGQYHNGPKQRRNRGSYPVVRE